MQGVNATQTNVSIAPFRAECSSMLEEGRGGEEKTREGFRVREAELEFLAL